jgi:hypothetical protein
MENKMKLSMKLMIVLLFVAFAATACNLPFQMTDVPDAQLTPNLTLTALFDTSHNIPATITPQLISTEIPPLPTVNILPTVSLPTNTPIVVPPTAVVVAVKQRAGAQMIANYLTTAPVMDGTYAEWVDKTHKYGIPYRVWKPANWSGAADLEGAFAAGWDNTYLYLAVKVTDNKYVQRKSGAYLYNGDSVELLVDTNLLGDFYVQSLDNDDYQIGFSAGNADLSIPKESYLWYPTSKTGSKSQINLSTLFETANSIYRIEAAIPWSLLGVTPTNGMRLGWAVSVSDDDSATVDTQEKMISTAENRNFLNPTTWGEIILVK